MSHPRSRNRHRTHPPHAGQGELGCGSSHADGEGWALQSFLLGVPLPLHP